MTKYRLNIPETIPKKFAHMANCLEWFDGKILTLVRNDESGVRYDCEDHTYNSNILTDWLSEIKESEFDNWWGHEPTAEIDERKTICKMCWQASQENRDLLYRKLVEMCGMMIKGIKYTNTDFWSFTDDFKNLMSSQLAEIKKTLQGND